VKYDYEWNYFKDEDGEEILMDGEERIKYYWKVGLPGDSPSTPTYSPYVEPFYGEAKHGGITLFPRVKVTRPGFPRPPEVAEQEEKKIKSFRNGSVFFRSFLSDFTTLI